MSGYIETNGYFTFDTIQSSTYGVWINGGGTYNAPSRRVKEYVVPGRNGVLTIDEGAFEEIDLIYPAFIPQNFDSNIDSFRNQLLSRVGYKRLEDTYHPTEFYRARYAGGLEADVVSCGTAGSFNLKFRRDPRRFLKTGETEVTISGTTTVTNPTLFASRPLIEAKGSGTITIGSDTITIAGVSSSTVVYIDCELQECYSGGGTSLNNYITLPNHQFPVLASGTNTVSGTTSVLKIVPRWWKI